MSQVVFDETSRDFVLEAFSKSVNDNGYIVEKDSPNRAVITKDGVPIEAKRFAGIRKGSEVYIKSDIISLIELCDDLNSRS